MIRANDANAAPNLRLSEKEAVEDPLLAQLETLGWTVLRLTMSAPASASFRADYKQVVLRSELGAALAQINPFLEADQIEQAVSRIADLPEQSLLENNRAVFDLLHDHTSVSENRKTGDVSPTVRYIDFDNPQNNRFLAIAQFKVAIPGTDHHIIPDVVLFVNGLPLVVVECKSPLANDPIASAIDQLLRYSQQRGATGEGVPALFWYNQFVVATCRNECKFGTVTTHIEKHWYRWSDPYPLTLDDIAEPNSKTVPNDQMRLVAGMCAPANLISLLQSFTLFSTDDKGKTIKIVARYQQFRAVKKAIDRLRFGRNPRERSGIIWHTQGSGKSLTMMFLVREMRQRTEFGGYKVIFITDRTNLEDQLKGTAKSIGQTVKVADSIAKLKELLKDPAPDLVMAMIHKFQERDLSATFPLLNDSSEILTLTDEAHRGQFGLLGANLDKAIPHAARVGYTGTPTEKAERTFGEYIDKYTMRESIADGTTLTIVYEGRTHKAELTDKDAADQAFEDVFAEYDLQQRLQILGYASRLAYLEADDTIRAKARDMVDHYVAHVFPNGFKGQVVATSREAAARYKTHLDAALADKAREVAQTGGEVFLPGGGTVVVDAARLRGLQTAVVISGGDHNELPHLKALSDPRDHKRNIERFKAPFGAAPENADAVGKGDKADHEDIALIIVNNMLLTGFDAPIEQVLYLDQVIRDHNLLQAIARVNRVADEKKEVGFVVDYVGVGNDLKRALDAYAEKESQEIVEDLSNPGEELGKLHEAHRAIWDLLRAHGLTDFSDPDAFYDLFYDEDVRFEYILAFKALTHALNIVFPRKEALNYFADYQNFVKVNQYAFKHQGDTRLSMKGIPPKLRAVTDAFLASQGIEVRVEPISILDEDFHKEVEGKPRARTKAAAVEHAIRHHLEIVAPEDPELAASFAAELAAIFAANAENWERIHEELEKLRQKIATREQEETFGLDRRRQMPIFRIIHADGIKSRALSEAETAALVNLTQKVAELMQRETRTVGFWTSQPAQNRLRTEFQELLINDAHGLPSLFADRRTIISRTMEWARSVSALDMRR